MSELLLSRLTGVSHGMRHLIELAYRRASSDVIERIAQKLNKVANSRPETKIDPAGVKFGGRHKRDKFGVLEHRPRVVTDDAGKAFLITHRGVQTGGKQAMTSAYGGKAWGDLNAADKASLGAPTSASKSVASSFSNWPVRDYPGGKGSIIGDGGEPVKGSRGKSRVKKIKPAVGTYLVPEEAIGKAWVRPHSEDWGSELEIRHAGMGDFLHRIRVKKRDRAPKSVYFEWLRELAQQSGRLVELSMVTAAQIAKAGNPGDRKALVKSLRRWLEKQGDRKSVRSAMGARPSKHEITTRRQAEVMTKDAYMRRAAAKHKDIFPDGDTWPHISYSDPDFVLKHKKLKRIERIAQRAAKNTRYQRATGNAQGYVNKGMPKVVKVNGDLSLLTYRGIEIQPKQAGGASAKEAIEEATQKLRRPRQGWEPANMATRRSRGGIDVVPRQIRHDRRAGGGISRQIFDPNGTAMSMSTNPRSARGFAEGGGPVGAYAIRLRDLVDEAKNRGLRGKDSSSKFAMVNSVYPSEREITQANGGNLIAVRMNDVSKPNKPRLR